MQLSPRGIDAEGGPAGERADRLTQWLVSNGELLVKPAKKKFPQFSWSPAGPESRSLSEIVQSVIQYKGERVESK